MGRYIICYDEGLQEQAEKLKSKLFNGKETEDNWARLSEVRKCKLPKNWNRGCSDAWQVSRMPIKKSIYEATEVLYLQKTDSVPEGFCTRLIKYAPFPQPEIVDDEEFKKQESELKTAIEKLYQRLVVDADPKVNEAMAKIDIPYELFRLIADEYMPTTDIDVIVKAAKPVEPLYQTVKTSDGIIPEELFDEEQLGSIFDKKGHIVTPDSDRVNHLSKVTMFRSVYTRLYGFVALTDLFVDELAKFLKGTTVLSVMSGSCTLEKHLINKGIKVVCSDTNEWAEQEDKYYQRWKCRCPNMLKLDAAEAIRCCGKKADFVLMSWPPYKSSAAKEALEAMREVNPDLIMIYIGEDAGGNCANDEFFDIARNIEDKTFAPVQNAFRSFAGMHDYIRLME